MKITLYIMAIVASLYLIATHTEFGEELLNSVYKDDVAEVSEKLLADIDQKIANITKYEVTTSSQLEEMKAMIQKLETRLNKFQIPNNDIPHITIEPIVPLQQQDINSKKLPPYPFQQEKTEVEQLDRQIELRELSEKMNLKAARLLTRK